MDRTSVLALNTFRQAVSGLELPEKFTYPYAYEPHPLAELAAKELQVQLPDPQSGISGKMYGVLVVENAEKELCYLAAFSGQDEEPVSSAVFVPPIYDRLQQEDFYKQGEEALKQENREIDALELSAEYLNVQAALKKTKEEAEAAIAVKKEANKVAKAARKVKREAAVQAADEALVTRLEHESIRDHYELKHLKKAWKKKMVAIQAELDSFQIEERKRARKQQSAQLQQKLFDQYQFLNQAGEIKKLSAIFPESPPAGAGDCAAPKLLQYAFSHQLRPVVLAEFWWGKPPKGALRKHLHYYPACRGKCLPILTHMLQGMELDDDPAALHSSDDKSIEILFEDEHFAIIYKPEGLLSVPARLHSDSVETRMKARYPDVNSPLMVHRLDWHTSGLMIITKSKEVYVNLQQQFAKRTVHKEYTAILDGILSEKQGTISLPLIPDFYNRPRQMVCFERGKPSVTKYQVISEQDGQTKVRFIPLTGRTHQLRVHAAHPEGLNTPILGDRLYGRKSERLFLHAASISFLHPITEKRVRFKMEAGF